MERTPPSPLKKKEKKKKEGKQKKEEFLKKNKEIKERKKEKKKIYMKYIHVSYTGGWAKNMYMCVLAWKFVSVSIQKNNNMNKRVKYEQLHLHKGDDKKKPICAPLYCHCFIRNYMLLVLDFCDASLKILNSKTVKMGFL